MNKERAGSLIITAAGVYGFIFSVHLPIGNWARPGPGLFPLILSILLCTVGVSIFVSHRGEYRIKWREVIGQQVKPLKIVLLTALFIVGMERVGYLIISLFYLFALLFWVCSFRLWVSLCIALAVTLTSAYLFQVVLGLQIPAGILGL